VNTITQRARRQRAYVTRDGTNVVDAMENCTVANEQQTTPEVIVTAPVTAEAIADRVNAALAYSRRRQPVLRVDSTRTSTRPECAACGVGIRRETTPVDGMHPRCAKVAADPTATVTMAVSSHAARVLRDTKYVAERKSGSEKADADRAAHAALLARFEANEAAIDAAAALDKATAKTA
jgi:hypothetical protein